MTTPTHTSSTYNPNEDIDLDDYPDVHVDVDRLIDYGADTATAVQEPPHVRASVPESSEPATGVYTHEQSRTPLPMRRTQSLQVGMQLSGKAQIIRDLSSSVPKNDFGLPTYIYRADLLPRTFEDLSLTEQQDICETAIVELDYSEGFPMQPDGEPFWNRLTFEPSEAHKAFITYLDMPRSNSCHASQKKFTSSAWSASNHKQGLAAPVRQLHLIKDLIGCTTDELLSMFYIYNWAARVQAYDMFVIASHAKQQEYRLLDTENNHFLMAQKYIQFAETFLDQVFASPGEYELSPKEALDLLMKMVQLQRISLGVMPNAPGSGKNDSSNGVPQNASMEVILRTMAQKSNGDSAASSANGNTSSDFMQRIFDNPDDLDQAQELIVRIGNAANPRTMRSQAPVDGFIEHNTSNKPTPHG